MLIDNDKALRLWLEGRLEPICDADPKALSKYVIALVKKDKSDDDLQSLCIDQLEVFLQGETVSFVNDLFKMIKSGNYADAGKAPRTSPKRPKSLGNSSDPEQEGLPDDIPVDKLEIDKSKTRSRSPVRERSPHRTSTRKAKQELRASPPPQLGRSHSGHRSEREERSSRRSDERSRREEDTSRRDDEPRGLESRSARKERERREREEYDREYRDTREYREERPHKSRKHHRREREAEERERSRSPVPEKKEKRKKSKKSKQCPDFLEKGVCTKGEACKYEHQGAIVTIDNDRATKLGQPVVTEESLTRTVNHGGSPNDLAGTTLTVPADNPLPPMPTGFPPVGVGHLPPPGGIYDPTLPNLSGLPPMPLPPPGSSASQNNLAMGAASAAQAAALAAATAATHQIHPQLDLNAAQAQIHQFQHSRGSYRGRGGRGGHHSFMAEDPLKIIVQNVPDHLNNITKLNEHFAKFGAITNIQVQADKNLAIVEFQTEPAVHAALNSPEPVLNNRFIQLKQGQAPRGGHHRGGHRGSFRGRGGVHDRLGHHVTAKREPPPEDAEHVKILKKESKDRISMARDQVKQRQEQKLENAKKIKYQLLVQQRDLLEKQIIEQKRLVEKLQDPTTRAEEKPSLLQTLKALATNTDDMRGRVKILENEIYEDEKRVKVEKDIHDLEKQLQAASTTGQDTQPLRLKLYHLQEDAAKLGIYARQKKAEMMSRGRGRGRGGRGRGGRGRGSQTLSQVMAQKTNQYMAQGAIVDRRPRKLRISGYTDEDLDEVIIHLSELGEVEFLSVIENGLCITVQYKTRADAELAATRGAYFHNKKLIVVWQKNDDEMSLLTSFGTDSLGGATPKAIVEALTNNANGDGAPPLPPVDLTATPGHLSEAQNGNTIGELVNGTGGAHAIIAPVVDLRQQINATKKRSRESDDDLLYSDEEDTGATAAQAAAEELEEGELLLEDEEGGGRSWRT